MRFFFQALFLCILLFRCTQAERINFDASKGSGLVINLLPTILNANATPFNSTLIPTSLNEGVSTSVSFTLTNSPSDSTSYQFVWEDTTGATPTLSPSSFTFSGSNSAVSVSLLPIDNNCLEDNMVLKVTRTSDNQVFRFTFAVIEADKCTFVTSSTYTGNFNGFQNADANCAAEKPAGLPGTSTDYKAMISGSTTVSSVVYQRQATLVSNCNMSTTPGCTSTTNWVLKAKTRYYRADATTLIFTTHASVPAFNFVSQSFTNSIAGTTGKIWTGLSSDWTSSGTSCLATFGSWTYFSGNSSYGDLNSVTGTAVSGGSLSCSTPSAFFCVRQ
ncbi:hypothetical protein A0128_17505 [Leptospira tipperaryensis]|uniref:DUF1554 domain-containing protein n=1 Tax=Leptospira tipperaryensis TaxID=2564040 RepID=A0A1D7V0V9_9LEPT|nr:DUF1554 domain-containing protein [Leptospira tipperaryensis]AOP35474.1 hypothetical protein A0128_17505 [Leptospira tipperaryensis]